MKVDELSLRKGSLTEPDNLSLLHGAPMVEEESLRPQTVHIHLLDYQVLIGSMVVLCSRIYILTFLFIILPYT